MSRSSSSDLTLGVAYWVIVVSLLVLGLLSMFTIGFALLRVATAMIVQPLPIQAPSLVVGYGSGGRIPDRVRRGRALGMLTDGDI
jgi:hypothetical protein